MKKVLRYTFRTFLVLLGILALLISCVFIYVAYNKASIIEKVRKQVAEKLNGDVKIGNIDLSFFSSFPNVSVLLENVSIKDTMFNVHHHAFLTAEKAYAVISTGNTILRNNPLSGIRIENASLYVFTDTSGYTNAYLFSPKKNADTVTKKSTAKTDIESIKLRNVRLVMENQLKHKLFDLEVLKMDTKLSSKNDALTFKTDDEIIIHSLAFNTEIGSYGKEATFDGDFTFQFDKAIKQLSFNDIDIALRKQKFNLTGQFNLTESPTFSLKVFAKNLDYGLAKSLVTPKIALALSLVQISKPVKEMTADISGPLNGGEPLVKASWKLDETDVQSKFVNITKCTLEGAYTNEVVAGLPRKDPNSRLTFTNLSGEYGGIEIHTKQAIVDNLLLPVLRCDVKADFELSQLNDLLQSRTIKMKEGKGNIDLIYQGPAQDNSNQNTLLNGKLTLSDGVLQYLPRKIQATDVSAEVLFKNSDVFVTDFKGSVLGNSIKMTGSGKNILALIKTNPGRLFLEWNIYSPSLNLNNFTSLLQNKVTTVQTASKARLGSTAQQLDDIVDYSNFIIKLKADELIYSKFKANEVKAILSLKGEDWILNKVNLQHAGGQMNITGSLSEKTANTYEASIKADMENVDVNRVMYAFNDFGQKGIQSENLKGKLNTTADVRFLIDRNTEQPSDISGYVDFSLKNGALLHYEPLKKVQSLIFKKRNFDEIYFAELKDRIDIKDRDITINRLEIQSTALTLFIEGLYSLKGNTDLSIQVPINNLKKRDETYVPENKGTDAKGGASIYLRGQTGKDGTVGFKLDVFKKLRKKKE